MKDSSAKWINAPVTLKLKRYDDYGSNSRTVEGKVWSRFAILKNPTSRHFCWNLTYAPTGEMIGLFRLQANAKSLAQKLDTLPMEQWREPVKSAQNGELE